MKKITAMILAMAISIPLFANGNIYGKILTSQEQDKLNNGETVIKSLKNYRNFSINTDVSGVKLIQDETKNIKPAYLAEVIKKVPYEGNEDLLTKLEVILTDVNGYVGIPYYSEHNGIWVDLYSSCNVLSQNKEADNSNIVCDLYMEPFGNITMDIKTQTYPDCYVYISQNTSSVKYSGITAVNKNKMKSLITVFRDGDEWILYGIGAVNAPDVFFMHDRIELSFMNRIKTFCNFVFNSF